MGQAAYCSRTAADNTKLGPAKVAYKNYVNSKYGYSVEYPTFLVPQGEPDAHDGQKFISESSPMRMSVWGTYSNWMSGEDMTIQQELDWTLQNLQSDDRTSPRLTYKSQGRGWFVISGTSGPGVFYQRTVSSHGVFATVLIEYPRSAKVEFDSIVTHVARSLKGP